MSKRGKRQTTERRRGERYTRNARKNAQRAAWGNRKLNSQRWQRKTSEPC